MIGYLSGPVDGKDVYNRWLNGQRTAYFGTSYLQQFFSVVTELGAAGHVITCHDGPRYDVKVGSFLISNRPRAKKASGWRYHLSEVKWVVSAFRSMHSSGSKIIILTDAQNYWGLSLIWRLKGIRFVNALHCALRPQFRVQSNHHRLLVWLTGILHYSFGDKTLAASPLIDRQLKLMPGKKIRTTESFLPTYCVDDFSKTSQAKTNLPSKSVLYAGRIEKNKGIFDLLDIAEVLTARHGPGIVVFDVCGEGSELTALRQAIDARGLLHSFRVHGFCNRNEILDRLASSNIVIVPTRTDFEEGFAMIVAEGVIAGRPVVTSRVCPALEVVREACIEVEPDDPQAYADAITQLLTNAPLAQAKQRAGDTLRAQFFDQSNSYGAKLKPVLQNILCS